MAMAALVPVFRNNLPIAEHGNPEPACSVCHSSFADDPSKPVIGHYQAGRVDRIFCHIHTECLNAWAATKNTNATPCPTCRTLLDIRPIVPLKDRVSQQVRSGISAGLRISALWCKIAGFLFIHLALCGFFTSGIRACVNVLVQQRSWLLLDTIKGEFLGSLVFSAAFALIGGIALPLIYCIAQLTFGFPRNSRVQVVIMIAIIAVAVLTIIGSVWSTLFIIQTVKTHVLAFLTPEAQQVFAKLWAGGICSSQLGNFGNPSPENYAAGAQAFHLVSGFRQGGINIGLGLIYFLLNR